MPTYDVTGYSSIDSSIDCTTIRSYVSIPTSIPNCISTTTWLVWNHPYIVTTTDSTTITLQDNWAGWNQYLGNYQYQQPVSLTPEQQAEQDRQAAVLNAAYAEKQKKAAEAKVRAHRLLVSVLTLKQRETYIRDQFFDVYSKDGKRRYRILSGRSGNVKLLNEAGKAIKSYCCHPAEYVPDEDTLVAQKLALEHDEAMFLKTANVYNVA